MDHNDNSLVNEGATGASGDTSENQAAAEAKEAKTYTQVEVDNMMGRMRGSLENKLLKPYEGLGDPESLRALKTAAEDRETKEQIKRGEFEKTLKDLADKKDSEISKRDNVIREYKVNTPLLNAAASNKAVAPEQVRSLLANQVRLGESGDLEVIDSSGAVRYDESGNPFGVDNLVREFIDANPHFGSATPSTTNTKSNTGQNLGGKLDVTKLDMSNPEHRKAYAEYRKSAGIN